jgi:peptidoglycan/LPS O-acetylase OafA/YrhL
VPVLKDARVTAARRGTRKISWDLVRTGCVTLVMLYHATFMSVYVHPELGARQFVFPYQVGASLLLVISAYFACVTIGRGAVLRYWWGRVARLLPPFLGAVLLIFAGLRLLAPETFFRPTGVDLAANVLMLWNWKPAEYPFIDGSHWTVPLQLMGFTVAALLYRGCWGHGRRIRGVLWVAVLVPLVQWPWRVAGPPEWYRTVVDGLGLHRWHLFVAGAAIWLWSTKRISTPHFCGLAAVCMLAQAMHNYSRTPEGLVADWGSTVAVCAGIVMLAAVAAGPDWDRVVPRWVHRPVRWFAGISYGVFLMHQALGYVVLYLLHTLGANTLVQTLAMLVNGVLLGWLLTRLVERPAYQALMTLFDRRAGKLLRRPSELNQPVR